MRPLQQIMYVLRLYPITQSHQSAFTSRMWNVDLAAAESVRTNPTALNARLLLSSFQQPLLPHEISLLTADCQRGLKASGHCGCAPLWIVRVQAKLFRLSFSFIATLLPYPSQTSKSIPITFMNLTTFRYHSQAITTNEHLSHPNSQITLRHCLRTTHTFTPFKHHFDPAPA